MFGDRLYLDLDFVWVKLGAFGSNGGEDVAFGGRAASPVRGGDLTLLCEESELLVFTHSTSSLNTLAADFVRVYSGLLLQLKSAGGGGGGGS
jgi:hypothetical protein